MCKVDKTSEVIDAAISYLIYKLKELDQQHQKNKEAILELLEGVATQDDQWDRRLENTRISHEIVKAKMSVLIELFLSFVRFVPRDKRQEITVNKLCVYAHMPFGKDQIPNRRIHPAGMRGINRKMSYLHGLPIREHQMHT